MKKTALSTLAIFALFTLTVTAESLNKRLDLCVKIADNAMRLSCFDKVAQQALLPQESVIKKAEKTEVATAKKAAAAVKAEDFGAQHLKKPEIDESELQIVFTIKSLSKDQHGKWRITFKNGQQWKQTDNEYLKIKVGESVLLKKGFLNAIYLKKNQSNLNKKIRVKRLK